MNGDLIGIDLDHDREDLARGRKVVCPMLALWEHLVLNELAAHLQGEPIHYWRDKQKHEVDFIVAADHLGELDRSRQSAPPLPATAC